MTANPATSTELFVITGTMCGQYVCSYCWSLDSAHSYAEDFRQMHVEGVVIRKFKLSEVEAES